MDKELQNILIKVGELYNKYGIKSITMDDVARELGISKKTLYTYVKNKNELVEKVFVYLYEQGSCTIKELSNKNHDAVEELLEVGIFMIQSIKNYNPSTEYDLKKYYPELHARFNEIKKERMYDAILKNIEKGKKEGLFRTDMNDKIIAKIQVSRFLNMSSGDYINSSEMLQPANILELFIYHIRGIANEQGLKVLDLKLQKIKTQDFLQ